MKWDIFVDIMMQLLKNTYPFMILDCWLHSFQMFKLPLIAIPSVSIGVLGAVLFEGFMIEWWYVPMVLMLVMLSVYAIDLYFAIILTGRSANPPKAWEFRTDRFKFWVADLSGAFLLVGFFNMLPIAYKVVMEYAVQFDTISEDRLNDGFTFLVSIGVMIYSGIVISGIFSFLSNGARAGVITWKVARLIMDRFDTYKPIAPGVKYPKQVDSDAG